MTDGKIFKPIDAAAWVLIIAASIGLKIFNPRPTDRPTDRPTADDDDSIMSDKIVYAKA